MHKQLQFKVRVEVDTHPHPSLDFAKVVQPIFYIANDSEWRQKY